MGYFGLTTFHNNQQFSGYDLQIWCMVMGFFLLWTIVLLAVSTFVGILRRRTVGPRTASERLCDVAAITSVAFALVFTSAVANQLGHGNTKGIVTTFYFNVALLLLWLLFAIFIRNRLWDWLLYVPLLIVNGILWSRALHSANGEMDPPAPVREPR